MMGLASATKMMTQPKGLQVLALSLGCALLMLHSSGIAGAYQQANLGLPNGYNLAAARHSSTGYQMQHQHHSAGQLFQQPSESSAPQQDNGLQMASTAQAQSPQNQLVGDQHQQQLTASQAYNLQAAAVNSRGAPQQATPGGLTDRDVSSPIFRFHGSALNATTVKLVWSLTSGYSADFFEIRYGPIPDTELFSLSLNGSARDYTISSLQPDEHYQFRLQAYAADGRAWRPQLYLVRTPAVNAAHATENREITPLGVKAEAKSNQTIQLSWSEQERPKELGAQWKRVNFIRYYVNPSQVANNNNSISPASTDSAAANSTTASNIKYHYLNVSETQIRDSRVIIHKLKPATEYAFAVKTVYFPNSNSEPGRLPISSGYSMDTLVRTFDLEPSAPRNFTLQPIQMTREEEAQTNQTGPKLELSWAPPESPNGQLRGYVILWAHEPSAPDEKWSRIFVNDSSINNWYVTKLRPGDSYYFKMRAINQRGQSVDTETRPFIAPAAPMAPNGTPTPGNGHSFPTTHQTLDGRMAAPIPANNILMLIVICLVAILFVLFLVVSRLFCSARSASSRKSSHRKATAGHSKSNGVGDQSLGGVSTKLNGYAGAGAAIGAPANSSTVTGRMGTLARRNNRQLVSSGLHDSSKQPDFWINAMDHPDIKSNLSEKSNTSDNINMAAMVSIQQDSPQQFTTQTTSANQMAPVLPEYRLAAAAEQQLLQQIHAQQQQQSHYHTGGHHQFGVLGYDQMDNASASAFMTLSKRQQQQLQKYQIQFAPASGTGGATLAQAPSPHQQPPPPPPLNIEQQQQQQQHQPLYGTHQALTNTRSLRMHRPTLYDPVSGSFVQPAGHQQQQDPPNYNSHLNSMLTGVHHQLQSFNNSASNNSAQQQSSTLQFHHPHHQTSTLMSRRSTNTLRSFHSAAGGGVYGQLGGAANSFAAPPTVPSSMSGTNSNGGQQMLQSHQAVINQLNDSNYPAMPLKHVSAVRPQIMSSLEDQIEMELAEKQAEQQQQQLQQSQQNQNT